MMQQKITRKQINYGDETQGSLMEDTDVNSKDWKHFSNYRLEKLLSLKYHTFYVVYLICEISMKIIMASFTELKGNSKMHTIHKSPQLHKETSSEKKQAQDVKLPDFI